jgi:hypothetical protein
VRLGVYGGTRSLSPTIHYQPRSLSSPNMRATTLFPFLTLLVASLALAAPARENKPARLGIPLNGGVVATMVAGKNTPVAAAEGETTNYVSIPAFSGSAASRARFTERRTLIAHVIGTLARYAVEDGHEHRQRSSSRRLAEERCSGQAGLRLPRCAPVSSRNDYIEGRSLTFFTLF